MVLRVMIAAAAMISATAASASSDNALPSHVAIQALTWSQMQSLGAAHQRSYYAGGTTGAVDYVWSPNLPKSGVDGGTCVAGVDDPAGAHGCLVAVLKSANGPVSPEMWGAHGDARVVVACHTRNSDRALACWGQRGFPGSYFTSADVGKQVVIRDGAGDRSIVTTAVLAPQPGTLLLSKVFADTNRAAGQTIPVMGSYGWDDTDAVQAAFTWARKNFTPISTSGDPHLETGPVVELHGNYLIAKTIVFGSGVNVDAAGGQLISGRDGLTIIRSLSAAEAKGDHATFGTAYQTFHGLTVNCAGLSGYGMDLDIVSNLRLEGMNFLNCRGASRTGVTASTTAGSADVTVSDPSKLSIGGLYEIDGAVTADGFAQKFAISAIVGNTAILDHPVDAAVSHAALARTSAGLVMRDVQQATLNHPEFQNNEWAYYIGGSGHVDQYRHSLRSTDINIIGGGQQQNQNGGYIGLAFLVRYYGFRPQYSASGIEMFLDNFVAISVRDAWFEMRYPGTDATNPAVYAGPNGTGLILDRAFYVFSDGRWRRFVFNSSKNLVVRDFFAYGLSAANPAAVNDRALVFQTAAGNALIENVTETAQTSPFLETDCTKWVIGPAGRFPGNAQAIQLHNETPLWCGLRSDHPKTPGSLYRDASGNLKVTP